MEGAGVARRHKGGGDSAAHDAWNQSSVSFVAARCSPTISVEIEINLCTIYVGVLTVSVVVECKILTLILLVFTVLGG